METCPIHARPNQDTNISRKTLGRSLQKSNAMLGPMQGVSLGFLRLFPQSGCGGTFLLLICRPQGSPNIVCELKEDACKGHHFQQHTDNPEACICAPPLLHPLTLLLRSHLFKLEVPRMCVWPEAFALQHYEENGANDWDEIQRKVHEITDNSFRRQSLERFLHHLAKLPDWIRGRAELAAFGDDVLQAAGNQGLLCVNTRLVPNAQDFLTPSNVSINASSKNIDRLIRFEMVELSLKTSSIVDKAARGPLKIASTAACGRYVKRNMKVVTLMPVAMVGASFDRKGFHKLP